MVFWMPSSITYLSNKLFMAKGKRTFQAGRSAESGLQTYVYAINKKNLPAGEKLKLNKYDKKLRKHVEFTFKDVK
jgi:ribosomal protein L33